MCTNIASANYQQELCKKNKNKQQNTQKIRHGPDKLCRLSKQKQTRTKNSMKLAQTQNQYLQNLTQTQQQRIGISNFAKQKTIKQ